MATNPIPNMNPTGVIGAGYGNTSNARTGGPGNINFGNTMNPTTPQSGGGNPYISASPLGFGHIARPMTSTMTPGGPTSTPSPSPTDPYSGYTTSENSTTAAGNPYGQSQSQMNWTEKYLQETYGGGMGSLIFQYLMSNGGYNSALTQQAVGAQTNAMGQQIQIGANDLAGRLAAMGVSGSSSEMSQALGNYENQAATQENAITAQEYYNMWNHANQNEANMMQFAASGTGKTLANKPNWMDYASMGMSLIGDAVGIGGGIKGLFSGGGSSSGSSSSGGGMW